MRYLSTSKPVAVLALVRSICREGQTGSLELETDDGTKRLYFVEGKLYLCRSVGPLAERLDDYLRSRSTWEASRLDRELAHLLQMTTDELSSWRVKFYRFAKGFQVDAQELVGPLPMMASPNEAGDPRASDHADFLSMVGGESAELVAKDLDTAQLKSMQLSRTELTLFLRLARPTRIESLLIGGTDQVEETLAALSGLWSLGLVQIHKDLDSGMSGSLTVQSDSRSFDRQEVSADGGLVGERLPESESFEKGDPVQVPDVAVKKVTRQLLVESEPTNEELPPIIPTSSVLNQGSGTDEPANWFRYFGLECEPFSLTPDPAFLFLSEKHSEALAGLRLSLIEKRGLCVMTGEVGTGKTTLLYSLLSVSGLDVRTAYLHNPALPFDQLLQLVLDDFGVSTRSRRRVDMLTALNRFLLSCAERGETAALVVDEAQTLSDSAFEALRLLLNFETFHSKLLQIILVGQPELAKRLESERLRQIADRVSIRCQLERLTPKEARQYILHRVEAARGELDVFSRPALRLVVKKSRGIPRRINIICHNAMLYAFGCGERQVNRNLVAEAVRDLSS